MIHVIIGTRAQLIKMAPVMAELRDRGVDYNFILLAQHRETIYEIIDQFEIKRPDIVVQDVGRDITSVGDMVVWSLKVLGQGLIEKRKIFRGDKRGVALIHGDAPPLLLGGLMAKFQGLKVAQVEAGLRSFNFLKPFPEEITRVLASRLGLVDVFFCQDEAAFNNVQKYKKTAHITPYNTILDSIRIARKVNAGAPEADPAQEKYAIVTIHRFETISKPETMKAVADFVRDISKRIKLLFILHPPTRAALHKFAMYDTLDGESGVELLPRQGFFEFNRLLKDCEFIISDGGSNQEESFYQGIPCLLFRNETERNEGLGQNVVLSKFDPETINDFVENYQDYKIAPVSESESPSAFILDKLSAFV